MVYRTTPKMNARKQIRRRKLLGTAIRIFGKRGYHQTTVPMIVAAAHSSIGSFYFYFRNKEDIFAAALGELGDKVSSTLNQAIAVAGPDVLSQMQAAVKAFVWFLAEHPQEARILLAESSGLGPRLEAVRDQLIASHTRSVERALRAVTQQLPPMEPTIVANCWVGAVYQSVLHWLRQPASERLSPEALATAVARFNLRGIGAQVQVSEQ
jgi:AcrR family transcriptional regulator